MQSYSWLHKYMMVMNWCETFWPQIEMLHLLSTLIFCGLHFSQCQSSETKNQSCKKDNSTCCKNISTIWNLVHLWPPQYLIISRKYICVLFQWKTWLWAIRQPSLTCCGGTKWGVQYINRETPLSTYILNIKHPYLKPIAIGNIDSRAEHSPGTRQGWQ